MPQVCCLAVVRLLFSSLFVLEPSSENSATPIIFYGSAIGVDNGVGVTPPMGWRHWKAFAAHIDQTAPPCSVTTSVLSPVAPLEI